MSEGPGDDRSSRAQRSATLAVLLRARSALTATRAKEWLIGRWIGIDYGTKRIGVAIADHGGLIASPATTLPAAGNAPEDARRILEWAQPHDPVGIVVGLPINMDGSTGPQAKLSQDLARQLVQQGHIPVRLRDERLTTFQAEQILDAARMRRSRRKQLRDALAAQVILQSYLDARRAEQAPPPYEPPATGQ